MNLDAIPQDLRDRPQWVVWRSVLREGKITKPPYQSQNPNVTADTTLPATWSSFDAAVACLRANPSLVNGIGFVFSDDDDIFGVDIDDEAKVKPEHLETRKAIVNELLSRSDTYTEISPSGTGLHLIGRGKLPTAGRRSSAVQIEVYGSDRYFTITGDVYNGRSEVKAQQELADWLFADHLRANDNAGGPLTDLAHHRRLDLSDEDVIREATNFSPTFAPRFNCQVGCEPGSWSDTFIAVIGVLDQITGKVDQIQRIVLGSPMVLQAAPNGGETRLSKAKRNFNQVLSRVRGNNTGFLSAVEHGRSIIAAIQARREEEAKVAAAAIIERAEEAFSKTGIELLKAFPLEPRYLELSPPPGVVGEMTEACMAACHNPFLKFAVPATLATLSGLTGRSFKLPSGSGLNANFVLAAPTATGKTQVMTAWESFMSQGAAALGNTVMGPAKNRIIKSSAASIQGIFEDFMAMPSCAWFISECGSQLAQMSAPKSSVDTQLRDAYNDLYDVSKVGHAFSPPRSVANRKANLIPVDNLSVATFWTTTTSKFDVFNEDAQDGFLSRVIVVRHTGQAGEAVPDWGVHRMMPAHLHERLVLAMTLAKNYDERYVIAANDAHSFTTIVSTDAIEGEAWAYRQIAERIKNAALNGDMPIGYTAVSRLPVTALRLAAVLAVMENPYTPAIMPDQFYWAFGYLLQNTVALLSSLDTGELGASASKDIDVVVRELSKMMRKARAVGIKKGEFVHHLRMLKPFKDDRSSPGEAVRRTITEMLSHGMLEEVNMPSTGPGRPAVMYCPTTDRVWK